MNSCRERPSFRRTERKNIQKRHHWRKALKMTASLVELLCPQSATLTAYHNVAHCVTTKNLAGDIRQYSPSTAMYMITIVRQAASWSV